MKIEMGESCVYSWLKHVKDCRIVQLNWKPSAEWDLNDEEKIAAVLGDIDNYFKEGEFAREITNIDDSFDEQKLSFDLFKKNRGWQQLLSQGECDVIGISSQDDLNNFPYAIDVAFHTNGLSYGNKYVTTMKVLAKMARTVLSLYAYMSYSRGEVIFVSPKIGNDRLELLETSIVHLERILQDHGLNYTLRLICNDNFKTTILDPLMKTSSNINDTSELFIRSYQLYNMFYKQSTGGKQSQKENEDNFSKDPDEWKEYKIGMVAKKLLRLMLEESAANPQEIEQMQDKDYSKKIFGLSYALLLEKESEPPCTPKHYYAIPITIYDHQYYLCNEWKTPMRPMLEKWIKEHK